MIMNRTVHLLDPLQFAYRPGRGVEDAVTTLLNLVVGHLENAKAHARVLYLDMSSAFNTLQPHLLFQKMISEFNMEPDLALWVLDFLVGRHQQVRVNNTMSSVKVVSTGSPQGCVLSPLLFILYTNGCRSTYSIGTLSNSLMTQLYSVCSLTMRLATALFYTTLLNGVINRICA